MRRTATLARGYLHAYENSGAHGIQHDGEYWLLTRLPEPKTIFDVGANIGRWSRTANEIHPKADIHAFEVVPSTARILEGMVSRLPRIKVHPFGLSDASGTVGINVDKSRTLSSFVVRGDEHVITEEGQVRRGDEFCQETGMTHIDLLKVDAEGSDHLVLRGFSEMLARSEIDVIQFEYGKHALETRFLLRDFFTLLNEHGMRVGKLFPTGVEFRTYATWQEDFSGLNYVAVSEKKPELINALTLKSTRD